MTQLSLFDRPPPPRAKTPDVRMIRGRLLEALRLAARCERMPWPPAQPAKWEEDFPRLAALLGDGEGDELLGYFRVEMERLKKAV